LGRTFGALPANLDFGLKEFFGLCPIPCGSANPKSQIQNPKLFDTYGSGWKSRSGKKRLNSIKIPAVMVSQMVVATGAVEMNLIK